MSNLSFRISIGNVKNDQEQEIPVMELNYTTENGKNRLVLGEKTYEVTVNSLHFNNRIYHSTELTLNVSLKRSDAQSNLSKPSNPLPTRKQLSEALLGQAVEFTYGGITETALYVHNITYRLRRIGMGSSLEFELYIFSLDKKLQLDKFCKAYMGQKLGAELLPGMLDNGGALANLGIELNKAQLQVLSYEKQEAEDKITDEFRQPYLVQYNETFYDFLIRTAHRCGELVYFTGGKLVLGLQAAGDPVELKASSYEWLDYPNVAGSALKVDAIGRSAVFDGLPGDEESSSDSKRRTPKASETFENLPYNFEVVPEDHYATYAKGEFTCYADELGDVDIFCVQVLSHVLTAGSYGEMIASLLATDATQAVFAAMYNSSVNKKYDQRFFPSGIDATDRYGDNMVMENATFNTQAEKNSVKAKLGMSLYALIQEAEKKVADNMVTVCLGSSCQDLRIGSLVSLEELTQLETEHKPYVVIGVEEVFQMEGNSRMTTCQTVTLIPQYDTLPDAVLKTSVIPPFQEDIPLYRQASPQLAFITDTDDPLKLGRVRLRYLWQPLDEIVQDSEERAANDGLALEKRKPEASPWVRISTLFASQGGGVHFRFTDGDEVLIDYENGNVEQPFVAGSLFSDFTENPTGWHVLSYNNPAACSHVISSRSGQSIMLRDSKNSLKFMGGMGFIPIWPLLGSYCSNMDFTKVLSTSENRLGGGVEIGDALGFYSISASTEERSISISSPFGDVSINAFTGISIDAPNGDVTIRGKNVSIKAGNTLTIESGTNIDEEAMSGKKLHRMVHEGIQSAIRSAVVDKIVDLSLVRSFLEVFLRPIDGTMLIKSNRFMRMEAGKGTTMLPDDAFAKDKKTGKVKNLNKREDENIWRLIETVRLLTPFFTSFEKLYCVVYNTILSGIRNYDDAADFPEDWELPDVQAIVQKGQSDDNGDYQATDFNVEETPELRLRDALYKMNYILQNVRMIAEIKEEFKEMLKKSLKNTKRTNKCLRGTDTVYKDVANKAIDAWEGLEMPNNETYDAPVDRAALHQAVKKGYRKLMDKLLREVEYSGAGLGKIFDMPEELGDYGDNAAWNAYLDQVEQKEEWDALSGFGNTLGNLLAQPFVDAWFDNIANVVEPFTDSKAWGSQQSGKILMSDKEGIMYNVENRQFKESCSTPFALLIDELKNF